MYYLWTDKPELFEAKIDITGASYKDAECRLVIETDGWNLISEGTVDSSGKCEIPIKKVKSILDEGSKGNMKLEIIVEGDVYFVPWSSEYEVKTSRKAVVEVVSQQKTDKPKSRMKVSVSTKENESDKILKEVTRIKKYKESGNIKKAKSMLKALWESSSPKNRTIIKNTLKD